MLGNSIYELSKSWARMDDGEYHGIYQTHYCDPVSLRTELPSHGVGQSPIANATVADDARDSNTVFQSAMCLIRNIAGGIFCWGRHDLVVWG